MSIVSYNIRENLRKHLDLFSYYVILSNAKQIFV